MAESIRCPSAKYSNQTITAAKAKYQNIAERSSLRV
jgi:hypothetical protein